MANQAAAADDEVSLAEIGQMLARQKWLITLIFIIIFAATAAYPSRARRLTTWI